MCDKKVKKIIMQPFVFSSKHHDLHKLLFIMPSFEKLSAYFLHLCRSISQSIQQVVSAQYLLAPMLESCQP